MRSDKSKKYQGPTGADQDQRADGRLGLRRSAVYGKRWSFQVAPILEIKRIIAGMYKLYVVLKYHLHTLVVSLFGTWRLPWLKLAIAGFAIFLMFKKDVQFSLNMKAPDLTGKEERQQSRAEEMSLSKSLQFRKADAKLPTVDDLSGADVRAYVKRFANVAEAEMKKFGIPASIKLAQGLLESYAGKRSGLETDHNHFGAPLRQSDYETAWENWRAHSVLIRDQFPELLELDKDYRGWAQGLAKAGYSSDKQYANKLIDVIDTYQLYLLDKK